MKIIKKFYILAIETSCDDTCIAILENNKVIFEKKISQTKFHKKFQGIHPQLACFYHYQALIKLLKENIDIILKVNYICYTMNPGLQISLFTGKIFCSSNF